MTILDEIFALKRIEVARQKKIHPLESLRAEAESSPAPGDFLAVLRGWKRKPALIAEVKFASPSKGILVEDPDPIHLTEVYLQNGAAAVSVLTDEHYFHGRLEYLQRIAAHWSDLPLLRKDFLFDPYQVYEARLAGADAVLLIVAGLKRRVLEGLFALAVQLGLTPLVEVHSETELELALGCGARLIGINNRDLRDFSVRLETTFRLCRDLPSEVTVVAESGIHTPEDVERLGRAGVDAVLVGEALVTAPDVGARVRALSRTAVMALEKEG